MLNVLACKGFHPAPACVNIYKSKMPSIPRYFKHVNEILIAPCVNITFIPLILVLAKTVNKILNYIKNIIIIFIYVWKT
jgi:hypothetical protein